MLISKIQSKDVWVTMEFPLSELKHIRDVLNHTEIKFDSNQEPKMEIANSYVQDHFYPILCKIITDIENDEG